MLGPLEVRFVGDEDVMGHVVEKQQGLQPWCRDVVQTLGSVRIKPEPAECDQESAESVNERGYLLGLGAADADQPCDGMLRAGGDLFTFQSMRRRNTVAKLGSVLVCTPGGGQVTSQPQKSPPGHDQPYKTENRTRGKKQCFESTAPYQLRTRLKEAADLSEDSESQYSSSDDGHSHTADTKSQPSTATPHRKSTRNPNLVEEYFEAHSSGKVLTSDLTLQKLKTPRLDQVVLRELLGESCSPFTTELERLQRRSNSLFHKWMLQLQLEFSVLLYGLGSKREVLETFRRQMLAQRIHLVVNGYFPSLSIKAILSSITEEVLEHEEPFRNSTEQLNFIRRRFKEDPSLELYLLIHNIDGGLLRGLRSQQVLSELSSLPGLHLLASIDHINAPLMWDQTSCSLYNWLWFEATSFQSYAEETSYENSLLVRQSGVRALSALTHVLRSLTPNARGIFKLLAQSELENKDNSSYPGLSFHEFYQQCRERFLVNSDLTLRAQLTEFRDHRLLRSKRGAAGVEYLTIPVDETTLTDFLAMEEAET
uniref:Origin recognition complex subunit 2 n=1 Tax=Callorhinchus milii TaxID=7868 RepID=V9KQ52_CALMI